MRRPVSFGVSKRRLFDESRYVLLHVLTPLLPLLAGDRGHRSGARGAVGKVVGVLVAGTRKSGETNLFIKKEKTCKFFLLEAGDPARDAERERGGGDDQVVGGGTRGQ